MPRKPKGDRPLSKTYSFRLPPDEARDLDERIAASRLTDSAFIRDYVLKNRPDVVAKPRPSLDKHRMQFVFNKTSKHVNEIAHVLDMGNQAHRLSAQLFRNALLALQDIVLYLKAALDHVD